MELKMFHLENAEDFESAKKEFLENEKDMIKDGELSLEDIEKRNEEVKYLESYIKNNIRYIFGFGRGYFSGDDNLKYFIEKNDEYYWLVYNYELDFPKVVKIKKNAEDYLKFAKGKSFFDDIFEFDILLEKNNFYEMLLNLEKNNELYEEITLKDFFEVETFTENMVEFLYLFNPAENEGEYAMDRFEKMFKQEMEENKPKIKEVKYEVTKGKKIIEMDGVKYYLEKVENK